MKPFLRFAFAVLVASVMLHTVPGSRHAASADSGWSLQRFHSDIAIQHDGSLLITETVTAQFDVPKHGIVRDIPVRYPYDATHERVYDLQVRSIATTEGVPWPYQQSNVGTNVELKIGDASRTLTGVQTYVITYVVRGALNSFPDHDELYWNVNGSDWGVPTNEVSANLRLDGGGLTREQCYEGPTGSQESCNFLAADDRAGFVAKRALAPGEQVTVVAAIRKGVLTEPAPLLVQVSSGGGGDGGSVGGAQRYFGISRETVGAALAVLLAGALALTVLWWRNGRDRVYTTIYYLSKNPEDERRPLFHRDQIVVEYTPPEGLRPAEMGLLLDERVDPKDLTATIIDFAVRGYLKITELGKEWVLGHPDWKLTRVGHPTDLAPWESTIYQGLMSDRDEVLLSDLHEDYRSALGQAQAELYGSAVERGWFATNPAKQRDRWGSLAWGMVVVGLLLTLAAGVFPVTGIVGVPMLILSVVMIPLSRKMSKRTAKGSELLRRVLGFRLYINTAEKDRQQFNEKEHLFATYLPFAIVFGCAGRWARVFGEVPTESVVGTWYHGAGIYPVTGLSNHIQGFSQTVAHCINVAPAAPPGPQGRSGFLSGGGFSGGFGGGGFAGGGGGGGGGGAW